MNDTGRLEINKQLARQYLLSSVLKSSVTFDDLAHFGALHKFNESTGAANTAFQADIGGRGHSLL
jgi:hypothetical protein